MVSDILLLNVCDLILKSVNVALKCVFSITVFTSIYRLYAARPGHPGGLDNHQEGEKHFLLLIGVCCVIDVRFGRKQNHQSTQKIDILRDSLALQSNFESVFCFPTRP